ncbi:hypothetical protein ABZP36_017861 [Zizania latifolia]
MLHLPRQSWWSNNGNNEGMVDLHELPNSTRLETIVLSLNNASLRLPATVVAFNSLTDLRLEEIRLTAGSERLFSRLLSSACCPRLRKLSLLQLQVAGITELQLEAGELSELTLESFQNHFNDRNLTRLELNTPNLRFLDINHDILDVLTISAPRLEELISTFVGWSDIMQINVGDLSCVRRIKDLELNSDRHSLDDAGINDYVICLLKRCTSLQCLGVLMSSTYQVVQFYYWKAPELAAKRKQSPSGSGTALPCNHGPWP